MKKLMAGCATAAIGALLFWLSGSIPNDVKPPISAQSPRPTEPREIFPVREVAAIPTPNVTTAPASPTLPLFETHFNESWKAVQRRAIEYTYGRAIMSFNLNSGEEQKLRDYLLELAVVTQDTRAVAFERGVTGLRGDLSRLVAEAHQDVYRKMEADFGAALTRQVEDMVGAASYLVTVTHMFAPALEKAGTPLQNSQLIPLAVAMKEANTLHASAESESPPLDERIVQRARSVLTAQQLLNLEARLGGKEPQGKSSFTPSNSKNG
jgi:hypothetical protein